MLDEVTDPQCRESVLMNSPSDSRRFSHPRVLRVNEGTGRRAWRMEIRLGKLGISDNIDHVVEAYESIASPI